MPIAPGLNIGQLVRTQGALARLGSFNSRPIHDAHVSDLRVAVGVGGRGEPVPHAMGLQVGRF